VGAGQAGAHVAASLRQIGFRGSVTIVGEEPWSPYERPPLTKEYLTTEMPRTALHLRLDDYWAKAEVDLVLADRVVSVDPARREVTLASDTVVAYGDLVWAAGGRARTLDMPAGKHPRVVNLRSIDDADALRKVLPDIRTAVVLGGGYLGLEVAAAMRLRGIEVTIVEAESRLLPRVTGGVISQYFEELHTSFGCALRLGVAVVEIDPRRHGPGCSVVLSDDTQLVADLVIEAVGLVPNTEPLEDAGIVCEGGVIVDSSGRTSAANVYAAGDCASKISPYSISGRHLRIESVANAIEDARIVADSIGRVSDGRPPAPPRFWSSQYGTTLQSLGLSGFHDDYVVRGDVASSSFSVVYLNQGRVQAIDCVNQRKDFAQARGLVADQVRVDRAQLADPDSNLRSLLQPT
jgi:3-phenylpropionate/trans-cinnamate dioxygenase ferredoxin reductase subunit